MKKGDALQTSIQFSPNIIIEKLNPVVSAELFEPSEKKQNANNENKISID